MSFSRKCSSARLSSTKGNNGKVNSDVKSDVYDIEKIVKERVSKTSGKLEYFIKWEGYNSSENTWEDAEQIKEQAWIVVADWEERKKKLARVSSTKPNQRGGNRAQQFVASSDEIDNGVNCWNTDHDVKRFLSDANSTVTDDDSGDNLVSLEKLCCDLTQNSTKNYVIFWFCVDFGQESIYH